MSPPEPSVKSAVPEAGVSATVLPFRSRKRGRRSIPLASETQPDTSPSPEGLSAEATAGQRQAFADLAAFCCAKNPDSAFHLLTGYAGTGKTWLVSALVRLCREKRLTVAVCAPTHKAVSVIRQKLEEAGIEPDFLGTLHALLGVRLKDGPNGVYLQYLARNPDRRYFESYDVVFIDEASMVNAEHLGFMRDAVRKGGTRVVGIGDPGQLLPVVREDLEGEATAPLSPQADLFAEESESPSLEPPLFLLGAPRAHLTDIVRQRSAEDAVHPIIQLSQEIRRYIEGEAPGVFDAEAIRRYCARQPLAFAQHVKIQSADRITQGATQVTAKYVSQKDIHVIAWRNAAVGRHNHAIHKGLAARYGMAPGHRAFGDPFWPEEIMVAREALYGFRPEDRMRDQEPPVWEQALESSRKVEEEDETVRPQAASGPRGVLIPNNTEMVVRSCRTVNHPYLGIPCWLIAGYLPKIGILEFFVAMKPSAHTVLRSAAWQQYGRLKWAIEAHPPRKGRDDPRQKELEILFNRAWAIQRACAPVIHEYAMTAHKSQGSTFTHALVDVADLLGAVDKGDVNTYHRALYVAVTRAQERVWLCL